MLPPSKIKPLSKNVLKLTGGSVGFTKIATASAHFSIGRKDGTYHAQHSEFYEDLLDDARQTHVILQDMTQRRAWHTDGQRFILHAILNRHSLKPYRVDCKLVKFDSAVCDQPDSVFGSMVQNRDLILRRDQHLDKEDVQVKLFRDEVRELYQMLEGLQAETENVFEAGIELKLSWEQQVQGWNYMEFLQRKPRMKVHETGLRKTCGQWPAFARDNGAVVFFADNFNDIIQPAMSASLCNKFKNVPRDKDYLTIQTSTLRELLHENHSLPSQALVTGTGLQWQSSAHLFEPCPKSGIRPTRQVSCRCDRIQQFSSRRRNAKIELPNPLPKYGAAIFGRGSAHTASKSGQLQSPSKRPVSAGGSGMQGSSVPVLETSYLGTGVEASSYPEHLDPVNLAPSPSDTYACTAPCHDVDMTDAGYDISLSAGQGYSQESQIETEVSSLFTRGTSRSSRTNITGFTDERFNPLSSESSYSNHANRNQGRMAVDSSYDRSGDRNEDFVFQPNGLRNDYINPNSHLLGRVTFNQAWNPAVTEAMIDSGPQIQHQEFLQTPAARQAFNSFGGKYEVLNQNPSPAETLADASSKKTLRRKRPFRISS